LFAPTAILGSILLAVAWPVAKALPEQYAGIIYNINLIVWFAAVAYIRMNPMLRHALKWRHLLILGVLVLGVFSPVMQHKRINIESYQTVTAESLSLIGLTLSLIGLIRWQSIHPYCAKFNHLLHRLNALPSEIIISLFYVAFLFITVTISWYCFSFLPAICDTDAVYVHAKIMAAGHLFGQVHPLHEFFPVCWERIIHGKWYTIQPPLFVFLLALGHLVGAPWLVNPMEGALTLVAIYVLTRRICDEPTARLAALLTLGCQMVIFMSSEYLSNAGALLFATLFFWSYVETLESLKINKRHAHLWALGAGVCLGGIFLIRPFTPIEVGMPFFLYSLHLLWRNPHTYFTVFLTMATGVVACLVFQGWYDLQTTGKIFSLPYAAVPRNYVGFRNGYTFWQALIKAQKEWAIFNRVFFEWSVPCVLFALLACFTPLNNCYLRLLVGIVISVITLNGLNHQEYFYFGPRYIYEMSSALIILTAVGIRRVPTLLASWYVILPERNVLQGIIALIVSILFAGALASRLPDNLRMYSNHYGINYADFYFSLLAQSKKPALIFIEREKTGYFWTYTRVEHANPPTNDAPVIFALDRDEKNHKLIEYYPNRNLYLERDGILYPIDKTTSKLQPPK